MWFLLSILALDTLRFALTGPRRSIPARIRPGPSDSRTRKEGSLPSGRLPSATTQPGFSLMLSRQRPPVPQHGAHHHGSGRCNHGNWLDGDRCPGHGLHCRRTVFRRQGGVIERASQCPQTVCVASCILCSGKRAQHYHPLCLRSIRSVVSFPVALPGGAYYSGTGVPQRRGLNHPRARAGTRTHQPR